MKTFAIALLVISTLSCAVSRPALQAALPPAPGPDLTFLVQQANQLPLEELSGVAVIAVGPKGRTQLGHTFGGHFTVSKERLRALDPEFLVFCYEGYWCAAIDLHDQRSPSLYEYDEYRIDLATIAVF